VRIRPRAVPFRERLVSSIHEELGNAHDLGILQSPADIDVTHCVPPGACMHRGALNRSDTRPLLPDHRLSQAAPIRTASVDQGGTAALRCTALRGVPATRGSSVHTSTTGA